MFSISPQQGGFLEDILVFFCGRVLQKVESCLIRKYICFAHLRLLLLLPQVRPAAGRQFFGAASGGLLPCCGQGVSVGGSQNPGDTPAKN